MTLATSGASSAKLSAVITRADGSVENLGVISYWHRNPIMRALWRLAHFLRII